MAERPFLGAGDVTSVSRKGHRSKRTWFEDLAKLQKRQDEEEQGDIRSLPGFRPEKMPGFLRSKIPCTGRNWEVLTAHHGQALPTFMHSKHREIFLIQLPDSQNFL